MPTRTLPLVLAEPSDAAGTGWQSSPGRIELLADADRPGGWLLMIERIRQSYVDLDDPTYLDFEYMRRLADVLDALPSGSLTAVHIGGGALTMARYLAATRPGSRQIVYEPDTELMELVRAKLPLPRNARIRVRPVDGRRGMAALPEASADLIILDAFHGGRVPAELGTVEFFADVVRVLRHTGVLLANLADGPPLRYTRRFVATVRTQLPEVMVLADPAVLRGRRFGNIELAAGWTSLPDSDIGRGPFPVRVVRGPAVVRFVAGARPLTDEDPMRSTAPPDRSWRISPV